MRAAWLHPDLGTALCGRAPEAKPRARTRGVPGAPRRQDALEDDYSVDAEAQARDAHRFHPGGDRARVHQRDVVASAPERDVRPERLGIESDLVPRELGAHALADRQHARRTGADPQPHHARSSRWRKSTRVVELDVERGHSGRRGLDRSRDVREPLFGGLPDERQRHVHELRLHAPKSGQVRSAAECRLGDLGGEWERDEEPYARRLEPRGVRLVRDKQRDERDPENAAEARERGRADPLAARDAFPCVGDQSTHCETRLSKQRAACSLAERVT